MRALPYPRVPRSCPGRRAAVCQGKGSRSEPCPADDSAESLATGDRIIEVGQASSVLLGRKVLPDTVAQSQSVDGEIGGLVRVVEEPLRYRGSVAFRVQQVTVPAE